MLWIFDESTGKNAQDGTRPTERQQVRTPVPAVLLTCNAPLEARLGCFGVAWCVACAAGKGAWWEAEGGGGGCDGGWCGGGRGGSAAGV
jgi:hypothetical protein